jgi:hypothetical protein
MLEKEKQELHGSLRAQIKTVPLRDIEPRIKRIVGGAISLAELPKKARIQLAQIIKLNTWHGEVIDSRRHEKHHGYVGHGKKRHGKHEKKHKKHH